MWMNRGSNWQQRIMGVYLKIQSWSQEVVGMDELDGGREGGKEVVSSPGVPESPL